MGSNTSVKVAAKLDGDVINAVDGSTATVRGTAQYNTLTGSQTGFTSATNERAAFALDPHTPTEGTLFCRFRTNQAFSGATLDIDHYLMVLAKASSAIDHQFRLPLAYVTADGHDGIEATVRNPTTTTRAVVGDLDLADDTIYSAALTWSKDAAGNVAMATYLNGRMVRGQDAITTADLPTDLDTLYIGNTWTAGNRPSDCDVGDVLYADEPFSCRAILKMHNEGLDLNCVNDRSIYQAEYQIQGYSRVEGSVIVKEYDTAAGRLWGHTASDRDILLYSDDDGDSWSTFHDFGADKINAVFVIGSNIFVHNNGALKRSSKTTASFSSILTTTGDSMILNGWGHTTYGSNLVVCEYETQPATEINRVMWSGDDGDSWTERKTITGNEEHYHNVAYDPYNGDLYATSGDTDQSIYRSTDNGATWTPLITSGSGPPQSEEQVIQAIFPDANTILFGSDAHTSRALLGRYDKNADVTDWDAISKRWSRVGPQAKRGLGNVFQLYKSWNGTLWILTNWENNTGHASRLYLSPDDGQTLVLAEEVFEDDLITSDHHRAVETNELIYIGAHRFTKTCVTIKKELDPLMIPGFYGVMN